MLIARLGRHVFHGQEHDALLLSLHTARQERRVRVLCLCIAGRSVSL